MKVVIVGGVAAGTKVAAKLKREERGCEVLLLTAGGDISYAGCGLPYYVGHVIEERADLIVNTPERFAALTGAEVRTRTEVTAINRVEKTVTATDLQTGETAVYPYDKLVLAPGARPFVPNVPGLDLENVFTMRTPEDADALRAAVDAGGVKRAVVVGGGFIGLEAAVALADMWGVKVSVVEMMDQILPGVLSQPLSLMAANDCLTHKVDVFTSEKVLRLEGENGTVTKVVTDKREISAQLVIFAAGFIPNGQLAKDAGLEVAPFGAVVVDEHMRTTDPSIYAGGDCVAIKNIICLLYTSPSPRDCS